MGLIELICDYRTKSDLQTILHMDIAELLDIERDFSVKISGKLFYKQPFFPILEFLNYYVKWNKCSDFIYNTIESMENPMISFKKQHSFWRIDSVWKKFDCKTKFVLSDFTNAVDELCSKIFNS